MARQQVLVDARLVVVALDVSRGSKLQQVAVAALVFAEQDQMVGAVGVGGAVKTAGGRDVNFAPDNRFEVAFLSGLVKLHGAEEVAVVRHRDRGHFQFGGPIHQFADFAGPVEETIVGMKMQMDEIFSSHAGRL